MRKYYYLASGEGERGTWRKVYTTVRGIKLLLTRERCHGDRWAKACEDPFEIDSTAYDGVCAAYNVETGGIEFVPFEIVDLKVA